METRDGAASSRLKVLSLIGLALIAAVLAAAYESGWRPHLPGMLTDEEPARARAPAAKQPAASSSLLKIDDDDQERGGIEAAVPKEIAYQEQARAYGVVLPLDRLVMLYNSSLTAAQQLKMAEVKLAASRTASARAKELLKVFPSAASQAELAEAAQNIDSAAVEAAKAQVETVRITAVQDWGPVIGPAIAARSEPVDGLVLRKTCLIQLTLRPGAEVQAPAQVEIKFGNGEAARADLVSAATQTDPKIASASYFYTAITAPSTLAGASVSAMLPIGEVRPSIAIPSSAVVWVSGRPWLYVKSSADTFERKPIDKHAIPAADGGYILPVSRWPKDSAIVVAGAQALLSQETKAQRSDEDND